ncbi:MAG: hypothetical protein PVG03_06405, partial [Desulfarculaceae bacterium]
ETASWDVWFYDVPTRDIARSETKVNWDEYGYRTSSSDEQGYEDYQLYLTGLEEQHQGEKYLAWF